MSDPLFPSCDRDSSGFGSYKVFTYPSMNCNCKNHWPRGRERTRKQGERQRLGSLTLAFVLLVVVRITSEMTIRRLPLFMDFPTV